MLPNGLHPSRPRASAPSKPMARHLTFRSSSQQATDVYKEKGALLSQVYDVFTKSWRDYTRNKGLYGSPDPVTLSSLESGVTGTAEQPVLARIHSEAMTGAALNDKQGHLGVITCTDETTFTGPDGRSTIVPAGTVVGMALMTDSMNTLLFGYHKLPRDLAADYSNHVGPEIAHRQIKQEPTEFHNPSLKGTYKAAPSLQMVGIMDYARRKHLASELIDDLHRSLGDVPLSIVASEDHIENCYINMGFEPVRSNWERNRVNYYCFNNTEMVRSQPPGPPQASQNQTDADA